jgi:hypothetical protein
MTTRTIGFVFIEGYADWEFGLLSGSAPEWFGAGPVALTPGGASVVSIGGVELAGQRGLAPEQSADLDAVAVIGSDGWGAASSPDVAPLLIVVAARSPWRAPASSGTRRTRATAATGSSGTCRTMPAPSATAMSRTPSPTAC